MDDSFHIFVPASAGNHFYWSGFAQRCLDPENWRAKFIHQCFAKGKKDFQDSIQVFLDDCRPVMDTLVLKAGNLFMDSDPDLSDHISRLNIPRDKGGLVTGEEKSDLDKLRASHIPGIFFNMHNTVLINTAGKEVTRKQKQGKWTKTSEQEDSSKLDPDRHPAASLKLENFVMISQRYDSAWFLVKAEIRVGLESNLRPAGHEHTLHARKRKLLDEMNDVES